MSTLRTPQENATARGSAATGSIVTVAVVFGIAAVKLFRWE